MKVRLSPTSIATYTECGLKYDLHYNKKIRPLKLKSALIFGIAIDIGFNALLEGKSLITAQKEFFNNWIAHKNNPLVVYSKADFDSNLLNHFGAKDNSNWESLYFKGNLMIETYHKEIMTKVNKVLAVQKQISIENVEGDKINGIVDIILEWQNGKVYVADNKTSSVKYTETSAKDNRQLPTYYVAVKEEYKPDGVMYIVIDKKINLNKVKTCKKCGVVNESSHKTCNELNPGFGRCNSEFDIKMNPKATYEVIINKVEESDEDRILSEFDAANHGISNNIFEANENSCIGIYGKCEYYSLCHEGSMDGLIKK